MDKRDYSKVKITHIMADGSVRDTMKGYQIKAEQIPLAAREIIRKMLTDETGGSQS